MISPFGSAALEAGLQGLISGVIMTGIAMLIRALRNNDEREDDLPPYGSSGSLYSWDKVAEAVPGIVQDRCKTFSSDPANLERYLKNCANENLIRRQHIPTIMKAYLSEEQFTQWYRSIQEQSAAPQGPSYDQIPHRVPQAVKDYCSEHAQEPDQMKPHLHDCADTHLISRDHIPAIIQESSAQPPLQTPPKTDTGNPPPAEPAEDTSLEEVLEHCNVIAHDPKLLENYLIQCITSNQIDCDTASQIWKAYCRSLS